MICGWNSSLAEDRIARITQAPVRSAWRARDDPRASAGGPALRRRRSTCWIAVQGLALFSEIGDGRAVSRWIDKHFPCATIWSCVNTSWAPAGMARGDITQACEDRVEGGVGRRQRGAWRFSYPRPKVGADHPPEAAQARWRHPVLVSGQAGCGEEPLVAVRQLRRLKAKGSASAKTAGFQAMALRFTRKSAWCRYTAASSTKR